MTLFASEEIHRHYRITKKISPFSFFLRWRFFFFSFLWFIISFFLLTLILSLLTWLLILSFLSVSISCNNIEKKFFRFCHLRERHIVCKFCLDKGLSRLPTNRRQKKHSYFPCKHSSTHIYYWCLSRFHIQILRIFLPFCFRQHQTKENNKRKICNSKLERICWCKWCKDK